MIPESLDPRTRARAIALQVLYEVEFSFLPEMHLPGEVLQTRMRELEEEAREAKLAKDEEERKARKESGERMPDPDPESQALAEETEKAAADRMAEFARQIIFGVLPITRELDEIIARYAPEWPLDQIAAIDRNILRIAFWEFAVSHATPVRVAINEAVELAKFYGSDSAPRFVNGVLGTLVEHEQEIGQLLRSRAEQAQELGTQPWKS